MEIVILALAFLFKVLIGLILAAIGIALLIVALPLVLIVGIIIGPFLLLGIF